MLVALSVLAACSGTNAPTEVETPAAEVPEPPPAPKPATVVDGAVVLETDAGKVTVNPVYHATTRIDLAGRTIWLDPWSKAALDDVPKADIILITDEHQDHMDPEALKKVTREGAVLVAPAVVKEKLEGFTVAHTLANGESVELDGLTVTAEPMYNLERGPEEGVVFHDKGRGNGYRLSFGGRTLYFAGDTECTPEMKALTGIDLAFLPMNLPYTMTPEEAAACVNAFKPTVAVPYHYAGSDLAAFRAAVEPGVTVETVEYYPGGLPW
ncbi:MAG: MBL fold metallo-hydrolase [Alphaproteobacteria bacterium]|nr:MBL fold metallo-hydrolase [Alphaproteobacteria bacterium]